MDSLGPLMMIHQTSVKNFGATFIVVQYMSDILRLSSLKKNAYPELCP